MPNDIYSLAQFEHIKCCAQDKISGSLDENDFPRI